MKVTVETGVVSPPNFDSKKVIDWKDSSDRKWLMNHLTWAMHNGREVTLTPSAESR